MTLRQLLVIGCGFTASLNVRLVGDVYGAEMLLPLLALIWIPGRSHVRVTSDRRFVLILLALCISLLGYVVSDLIQGTREDQYLRGWGRIVVVAADVFCLGWVCSRNKYNFWWFALGIGLGSLLMALAASHPITTYWKSDYAKASALIVAASGAFMPGKIVAILLAGLGIASMYLDFRSFSAVCLAAAAIVFSRAGSKTTRRPRRWLTIAGVLISLAVALGVALWLAGLTNTEDSLKRRDQSNAGRMAGWSVGLYAIQQSPIVGWGSWTENRELARYFLKQAQEQYRDRNSRSSAGSYFAPHSQILQAWVEGGVLGALFFVVLLWQLFSGLKAMMLTRPHDRMSALLAYVLLLELWDLFMSPFAAGHRLDIALATVAAVLVHKRWPEQRGMPQPQPKAAGTHVRALQAAQQVRSRGLHSPRHQRPSPAGITYE